ncbi:MAG: hypothetical protein A2Z32_04180 [Chloroflexi bacterium RBG_16_69_14]|nr:MAG: hypothetical protein A2Z32_04180 [Chloroflexi bacterium RBG_16_69_14]
MGPGAIRTRSPICRADPRTGRLADGGNGGSDGETTDGSLADDVPEGGVGVGDVSAGRPGVVLGAGLAADAQAVTSRPTTIVVAKRECDGRIRCPPDGV